jgi:hypothetical protein
MIIAIVSFQGSIRLCDPPYNLHIIQCSHNIYSFDFCALFSMSWQLVSILKALACSFLGLDPRLDCSHVPYSIAVLTT